MELDRAAPDPATAALSLVAASPALPPRLLAPLSLVCSSVSAAAAASPHWASAFARHFTHAAKVEELAALLPGAEHEPWEPAREDVARARMRADLWAKAAGKPRAPAPEMTDEEEDEVAGELAGIEETFEEVLEEVRALEGKTGHGGPEHAMDAAGSSSEAEVAGDSAAPGPSGAASDSDVSMDGSDAEGGPNSSTRSIRSSDAELAERAEHLSVSSGGSALSVRTLAPGERLVHLLRMVPNHLPSIRLLAFLLLLEGHNEACAEMAHIGIEMGGDDDFRQLADEADPPPHATPDVIPTSLLSDPTNPPFHLRSSLLTTLLRAFRAFGGDAVLPPAGFATAVHKANGHPVTLKEAKSMVAALEGGVDPETRIWTGEWLAGQPAEGSPAEGKSKAAPPPARVQREKEGLSLAGWLLFFSRQVHAEGGEEETARDLERMGFAIGGEGGESQ
ncbi:hypothetical protein DFJ74DRAFT_688307 [Hyaloraphidium curvatum]|nr:hypothetical protein DFJ74DRAFT_688307 [Hyaloraphidium curvatum]